jgi:hypothetical protein
MKSPNRSRINLVESGLTSSSSTKNANLNLYSNNNLNTKPKNVSDLNPILSTFGIDAREEGTY